MWLIIILYYEWSVILVYTYLAGRYVSWLNSGLAAWSSGDCIRSSYCYGIAEVSICDSKSTECPDTLLT